MTGSGWGRGSKRRAKKQKEEAEKKKANLISFTIFLAANPNGSLRMQLPEQHGKKLVHLFLCKMKTNGYKHYECFL